MLHSEAIIAAYRKKVKMNKVAAVYFTPLSSSHRAMLHAALFLDAFFQLLYPRFIKSEVSSRRVLSKVL
jgi:hypothetical protein